MRDNLTKKEIINSIYMQIGYSKKICEALIDDFFDILLENLIKNQKVKISGFGTFFLKKKKKELAEILKLKKNTKLVQEKLWFFLHHYKLKKK